KTTTFRLLLGLLTPEAGVARIGGYDSRRQLSEVQEVVGYVAQAFTLYGDLSVAENMQFVAEVRGLETKAYEERARELLAVADLPPDQRGGRSEEHTSELQSLAYLV